MAFYQKHESKLSKASEEKQNKKNTAMPFSMQCIPYVMNWKD